MVTAERFVEVWQASTSVREVATTLQMKPASVISRGRYYRKRGVKLKSFGASGGERLDVSALNKMIEEG